MIYHTNWEQEKILWSLSRFIICFHKFWEFRKTIPEDTCCNLICSLERVPLSIHSHCLLMQWKVQLLHPFKASRALTYYVSLVKVFHIIRISRSLRGLEALTGGRYDVFCLLFKYRVFGAGEAHAQHIRQSYLDHCLYVFQRSWRWNVLSPFYYIQLNHSKQSFQSQHALCNRIYNI